MVIAGVSSSCGKTTVAIGIMGALKRKGMKVQAFKVGPDYIDTSYHTSISGRPSRNLDAWMVPPKGLIDVFARGAKDADIAVIEGVMGLYDGAFPQDDVASTAHVAKLLDSPCILVIDVYGLASSAAAIALGYKIFDKGLRMAGIIINKVSGQKHADYCKGAIERATGIPVVGSIPFKDEIALPERHLGLIPISEGRIDSERLSKVVDLVEDNVDIDKIVEIASSSPHIHVKDPYIEEVRRSKVKIGVALDEAFNFYYQDNFEMLRSFGAEITFFSPIHDKKLPSDLDGLYIGGGFPEVLSEKLESNESIKSCIKKAAEDGMPIYAECGGLMYLTKSITDLDGRKYRMVGFLDCETVMTKRLTLNYTHAKVIEDNIICKKNENLRGHEFHHSLITDIPKDAKFAYKMERGVGIDGKHDGLLKDRVLASYMHVHFAYNTDLARSFVEACENYKKKK